MQPRGASRCSEWMLDPDTCIAVIKKHQVALKKMCGKSIGQVGISSITLGEVTLGAAKSGPPKAAHDALDELLLALEVVGVDEAAAMTHGDVRASLEQQGKPIGPLDTLFGSHVQALGMTLVTHNTREFSRIDGRRLEDWIAQ